MDKIHFIAFILFYGLGKSVSYDPHFCELCNQCCLLIYFFLNQKKFRTLFLTLMEIFMSGVVFGLCENIFVIILIRVFFILACMFTVFAYCLQSWINLIYLLYMRCNNQMKMFVTRLMFFDARKWLKYYNNHSFYLILSILGVINRFM